MKTNYETLTSILEGTDCTIFVVFNPDLLSLTESQRLVEGLHDLHLPLRLMINNKVSTENEEMADHVEKTMMHRAENIPVQRIALHPELQTRNKSNLYEIEEDIASPILSILKDAR